MIYVHLFSQPLEKTHSVSLNCSSQPLRSVLENIRIQTGINFVYHDDLANNFKVTCKIRDYSVENALEKILDKTDISYKYFQENSVVLYKEINAIPKPSRAVVTKQDVPVIDSSSISSIHTFTMPKMVSSIDAYYPPDAIKNNIQGNVKVRFLIDTAGSVSNTVIETSSGFPVLDSAAIGYLYRSKFIPAKADGKPRNRWLSLIFKYSIK